MVLNFIQWNCHSISKKTHYLEFFKNNQHTDVFCLVETWLKDDKTITLPGFNVVSVERQGKTGGGVAVLLRNSIKYEVLNKKYNRFIKKCNDNAVEILFLKLYINREEAINLMVVYSPPRSKNETKFTEDNFWKEFIDFTSNFDNLILCGDFNAISFSWSQCVKENGEGKKLDYAVNRSNLICLNNDEPTWSSKDLSSVSTLDLTFISPNLLNKCIWEVFDYKFKSDHFPIKFSIDKNFNEFKARRPKLITAKINWLTFKNKCDQLKDFDITTTEDYEDFINKIKTYAVESGGKITNLIKNQKKYINYWWDDECQELINENRKAFQNYKINPTIGNEFSFLTIQRVNNKKLKKKKYDNYQNYCNSININSNPSDVWKIVDSFKNKTLNSNYMSETNIINEDSIKRAFDKVAPLIRDLNQAQPDHIYDYQPHQSKYTEIFQPDYSIEEYKRALASFKTKTAPGPDLIDFELLSKLPTHLHTKLLKFFNILKNNAQVPDSWREFFIIFIPKSNGTDLRPISLAQCLYKLYEKLIQKRMEWWSENNDIVPKHQTGFRKNKSCVETVAELVTDVTENMNQNKITGVIFLDIVGAYDNVDPTLLYRELWRAGLPPILCKNIFNLIKSRKVIAYSDGEKIGEREIKKGLPQGAVSSPPLFNIYLRNIKNVLPEGVEIIQYADDIAIYYACKNLRELVRILSIAFEIIKNFLNHRNLQISETKTKIMFFAKFNKLDAYNSLDNKIKLNDQFIECVTYYKYLGFHLKYNLNWDIHIANICKTSRKLTNIIKSISSLQWGGHPKILINIYKGLIRSRLEWGCQLFNNCSKTLKKKLDVVQYGALRAALGLMCSTPTNVILDLANEPPLESRRIYLTKKFVTKILAFNNNSLKSKLKYITENNLILNKPDLFIVSIKNEISPLLCDMITLKVPSSLLFNYKSNTLEYDKIIDTISAKQFIPNTKNKIINNTRLKNITNKNFDDFILKEKKHCTIFYTDGSLDMSRKRVGFGVFCPKKNIMYSERLNDMCTIFEAEAKAIIKSLIFISEENIEKATIVTDSLSVLKALSDIDCKGNQLPIIYSIKYLISSLQDDNCDITFIWVPSHVGILGNDKADDLAKQALNIDNIENNKIHYHSLFNEYKREAVTHAINILRNESLRKGKKYFDLKNKILNKTWFDKLNLDRSLICFVSRLRSSHVRSNDHLFNKNIISEKRCKCGAESQDVNHLFFYCKFLNHESGELLIHLYEVDPDFPKDISSLAFSNNIKIYKLLYNFSKENNVLI